MNRTKRRGLNPTILFVIMLGIGLPLSFSRSVILNAIIMLFYRALPVLGASPLADSTFGTVDCLSTCFRELGLVYVFGTGDRLHAAWIYGTRVYAYLLLAMILTMTHSVQEILLSLHHHLHLSNTFVYGLLGSFNMMKNLRDQYRRIKYSAMLRDAPYHFWQAHFYLRLIITALNWSNDLAIAMTSQGFTEGAKRTELSMDPLPAWQWGLAGLLIVLYCGAAFLWRPW